MYTNELFLVIFDIGIYEPSFDLFCFGSLYFQISIDMISQNIDNIDIAGKDILKQIQVYK